MFEGVSSKESYAAVSAGGAPIDFQVEYSLKPGALSVHYVMFNTRANPIYVFNVLWEFDKSGKQIPASQPVYACLRQDGTLHLAKEILPVPAGKKIYARIVPLVTRLDPGRTLEETIQIPAPVAEYNPYFPVTPDSKQRLEQARAVEFSIQFVNQAEGMETHAGAVPPGLRLDAPNLFANLETLRGRPDALPVPVQKRLDNFEEF